MAFPLASVLFDLATVCSLLVGGVAWYRNREHRVPRAALVLLIVRITVFLVMTPLTDEGAKATYEVDSCEAIPLVGEPQPFESLSDSGQAVFLGAMQTEDEYRTHTEPQDIRYATDQIQANPIRYEGTCYAVLARQRVDGSLAVVGSIPILAFGGLYTIVGIRGIRSGRRTVHATALLAGTGVWLLISALVWPITGPFGLLVGAIGGCILASGVEIRAALWPRHSLRR
ncbi:MAG: hypothetical protein ABEI98_05410 [Halorhabdus sp.]